jgi:hypothetical protein
MPSPANTVLTQNVVGTREDLEDIIYRIGPEETPFQANVGRGKAKNTRHEWQIDSLAAPDGSNAFPEGDDVTPVASTQPVRVANICQISRKSVVVADTVDATDRAGRDGEEARIMVNKGLELRRDVEKILLANTAATTDNGSGVRILAGLPAWLTSNIDKGAGGANGSLTAGLPATARTDGTQRAFTEAIVKNVLQLAFTVRGRIPSVLSVGPVNKGKFSAFTGIASSRFNIQKAAPATVIGAADVYVGDFGNLTVVPNIFQRERDAFFLDYGMLSLITLRPLSKKDLGVSGDNSKSFVRMEYTLKVHNEAAHGMAADLLTT